MSEHLGTLIHMEHPWNGALDALPQESELQTVEQKIAYANVLALLSIGQELSGITTGESKFSEAIVHLARHVAPKAGKGRIW